MKKVSIVLATYNRAHLIKKAIDSCLNQTYKNIELILINDASPDNTSEIIKSYLPAVKAGNDDRIKYIELKENVGATKAYNKGLTLCTGEYLTWTSDDNYYTEDAIEIMVDFLEANKEIDFVYSNYYCINERDEIIAKEKVDTPDNLRRFCCIGACFLYKYNVYKTIGGFDGRALSAADYDYWIRIYKNFKMQKLDNFLYYYGRYQESDSVIEGDFKIRSIGHKVRDGHFYPLTKTKEYEPITNTIDKKLNILVVSNLYPPYYIGGYELVCKDIVDSLRSKGHNVSVLTSNYGVEIPITGRSPLERDVPDACSTIENNVYRELTHYFDYGKKPMSFKKTLNRETRENDILKKLVYELRPDVLFLFNMGALSKSLLKTIESFDIPVVYDISDYWLACDKMVDNWLNYWQSPVKNKLVSFIKMKFLGLITQPDLKEYFKSMFAVDLYSLNFNYTYFTSKFLKFQYSEFGFPCSSATIFYRGIDTKKFITPQNNRSIVPLKLLYSGGLHPDKGAHTAIEAVNILTKKGYEVTLSIAGGVRDKEYVDSLYKKVEQQKLPVKFLGLVPCEEMPKVYPQYDVLLFTTIKDEPFSLTIMEAMSSGLAVVSTPTGGSAEILKDKENSLVFKPDNAEDLAEKVESLIKNPDLIEKLGKNGAECVRKDFEFEKMIEETEKYLKWAVGNHRQGSLCAKLKNI
ncbi:MAG: glycosyltransferase [bacterium]